MTWVCVFQCRSNAMFSYKPNQCNNQIVDSVFVWSGGRWQLMGCDSRLGIYQRIIKRNDLIQTWSV